MVPSIDETGLNELKRLSLQSFKELECIIDTTRQQDVASSAFSNLVDLSLRSCYGLREICSGGRPPRGFLENLETLKIRDCDNMSSLFPSWVLIQRLRKLKKVTVWFCDELEDVFQLEGLCYAKENPFLLSTLESLDLRDVENLRYIWKGPTQQVSLQSLTVVNVDSCNKLRYLFTLSLARSLLKLEQLTVKNGDSFSTPHSCLEHIVKIKEAEENIAGGGGNEVMFPKLRILQLDRLENFINFFSEIFSSTWPALNLPLNSTTSFIAQLEANVLQTSKEDHLRWPLLFPNLSSIDISGCGKLKSMFPVSIAHLLSLQNLTSLKLQVCPMLTHLFSSTTLVRNLLRLESIYISRCSELEQIIVEDHTEDDHVQLGLFPNLSSISIDMCGKLKTLFPFNITQLGLQKLKSIDISGCKELEQINVEDHAEDNHVQLGLFPNLSSISIKKCGKLKSLFPVSIAHLLSLQNLTILRLGDCQSLTHLFSSTLARNLLQLESIVIWSCKELEQIIVRDHTEDDHVQLGLFPNLSSLFIDGCDKLKTLSPVVTIARSGLQKLKSLNIRDSFQLEELFGHKDEADMTSDDREMVLPQLEILSLQQLASLVNFCPVGYHFIFPSLSELVVTECPKLTTRFSVDQNRSVHAEAEAPQIGKEDVDMEQSSPETTVKIKCRDFDDLRKQLPPYIVK